MLSYPPFSHLIRIQLGAEEESRVATAADRVADLIGGSLPADTSLLGPAPMFRARNRYRRRILIKSPRRKETVAVVRDVVDSLAQEGAFRKMTISVDVDPQ